MSMRWRWTIYLCTLPYLVQREYTWPMVHNQCTWGEGGPYIYALCLTWSIKGLALFLSQVIYTLYPIQWFVRVTLVLNQVIYKTTWFVAWFVIHVLIAAQKEPHVISAKPPRKPKMTLPRDLIDRMEMLKRICMESELIFSQLNFSSITLYETD